MLLHIQQKVVEVLKLLMTFAHHMSMLFFRMKDKLKAMKRRVNSSGIVQVIFCTVKKSLTNS